MSQRKRARGSTELTPKARGSVDITTTFNGHSNVNNQNNNNIDDNSVSIINGNSNVNNVARGSVDITTSFSNNNNNINNNIDNKLNLDDNKIEYGSESEESLSSSISDLEPDTTLTSIINYNIDDIGTTQNIQQSIYQQIEQKKILNKLNNNSSSSSSSASPSSHSSLMDIATSSLICCKHEFKYKPYGFSVAPDAFGCNSIITKVTTKEALDAGLKIGFVVAGIDNQIVLDMPHEIILQFINNAPLPTLISFADRGIEYEIIFKQKPLGFSVMKDENMRNARVCRITSLYAQELGVKIDSYLLSVNGNNCWGLNHSQIINKIKSAKLPIKCVFRQTPKLKLLIKQQSHNQHKNGNNTIHNNSNGYHKNGYNSTIK